MEPRTRFELVTSCATRMDAPILPTRLCLGQLLSYRGTKMEPPSRLELETPSLPWTCSTTELRRQQDYFITPKTILQVKTRQKAG